MATPVNNKMQVPQGGPGGADGRPRGLPGFIWFYLVVFCLWTIFALLFIKPPKGPDLSKLQYSLDEQIGQLFMVGFKGLEVDEHSRIIQDIKSLHLGGVVLFDKDLEKIEDGPDGRPVYRVLPTRNIESAAQVKRLTATLQAASKPLPLLIAVDQEGGKVVRLSPERGFPETVSAALMGQINCIRYTYDQAERMGDWLFDLGINLNLAPCVDLAINPRNPVVYQKDRAIHEDAHITEIHAKGFIEGLHEAGVLSCIKHFPGHGSSDEATESGFVNISKSWKQAEIKPYDFLNRHKLVDMVMVGHLYCERLDPVYPATLSKDLITGLLRERMGYQGVVVTDDIQMRALYGRYTLEQIIHKGLDAGVDLFIIANTTNYDPEAATRAVNIVKDLVAAGKISPQRIRQSFERLLLLKMKQQELAYKKANRKYLLKALWKKFCAFRDWAKGRPSATSP